jgi:hypothetical protein
MLQEAEYNDHEQVDGEQPEQELKGSPQTEENPTLASEAFYGLPGKIVETIDPHTEADKVAVLVTNLAYFGNIIGRGPHFLVEATPHFTNIYSVFAGRSSKSRKGTSRSTTDFLYKEIDTSWVDGCFETGLASGEGLIHRVRDPLPPDPGVTDKRLMVIEEEFSRPLKNYEPRYKHSERHSPKRMGWQISEQPHPDPTGEGYEHAYIDYRSHHRRRTT